MTLKFAIFLLLIAGCSYLPMTRSSQPVQSNPTAEALLAQGMAEFSNKRYTRAIEQFQKIRDEFPFTPQAPEVELRLGEAYYLNKQYPEATQAFKDFLALHPRHESVPFVLYHLGLVHLDQFTSVDRDQKTTEIAKGYFESVVKEHPKSPYASQAKEKLAKCLEHLAEHEFMIASFYMREEKYPAAIGRLEEILRRYRDSPSAVKALYQLGESYRQEKNGVKAALAYEALIQHYPKSDLAREAQIRLSQLEKEKHDPLEMLLASSEQARKLGSQEAFQPPSIPTSQPSKAANLVAKKEVVVEEPGSDKGLFRRVADTFNPFAWFSSSDRKKENQISEDRRPSTVDRQPEEIETAKKEESSGFFSNLWSGINPLAKKGNGKGDATRDPEFVAKVDESLKQRGVIAAESPKIKAPATELPRIDPEPPPRPLDAAFLGEIDAKLKSQGKDATQLPAPPESAQWQGSQEARKPPSLPASQPSTSTVGLLGNIDESLKQKGIEPPKQSEEARKLGSQKASQPSSIPASQPSSQIKLEPKLTVEKGPLFLETGEFEVQQKATEGEEARKPGSQEASQPPSIPASQLPQVVIQGPPQPQKEKATEIKPAEKRKAESEEEEETKGVFDRMKEDLRNIGKIFNPFGW